MIKPISVYIFIVLALNLPILGGGSYGVAPQFPQLSARAIGLGSAMTAVSGDEQCIFYNPAGLASVNRFRIGQSHSLRHFPGPIRNLDQLDSDPTAIIYPLRFAGVFGAGFVLQGELGYDYLSRNDMDFPQKRLWGTERYDAYAAHISPFTKIGMYHRSRLYHTLDNPWEIPYSDEMQGEGFCFGLIQTILPGIDYGYSTEKMDDDFINGLGVTTRRIRSGWSIRPLPWIQYVTDREKITQKTLIRGERKLSTEKRANWGIELAITPLTVVRWGRLNGHKTSGFTLGFGRFKLNYGEAKDMMPWIVGSDYPDKFKDIHLASYSVEF